MGNSSRKWHKFARLLCQVHSRELQGPSGLQPHQFQPNTLLQLIYFNSDLETNPAFIQSWYLYLQQTQSIQYPPCETKWKLSLGMMSYSFTGSLLFTGLCMNVMSYNSVGGEGISIMHDNEETGCWSEKREKCTTSLCAACSYTAFKEA